MPLSGVELRKLEPSAVTFISMVGHRGEIAMKPSTSRGLRERFEGGKEGACALACTTRVWEFVLEDKKCGPIQGIGGNTIKTKFLAAG